MSLKRFHRAVLVSGLIALAAGVGHAAPAGAQGGDFNIGPEALEHLLARAVAGNGVPGIVARLVDADGEAVTAAAGKRQRGAEPAFLAGDPVHIGSCLKAMTATVVARLVDRGVIRWDTTLAEVFPEQNGALDPALRSVTLEELLAHRSGLTDEVPARLYAQVVAFQGIGRAARKRFMPEYLALPPRGVRGDFSYSNFGYALVGAMLERVTGRAYDDLIRREVFAPLGMRSARFGAPGSNDPGVIDAPRGHDPEGRPLRPAEQDDPPILAPAGTFSMTLNDWSKFARVQMGVPVHGELLVSAASLQRMQSAFGGPLPEPQGPGSYGLGWSLLEVEGETLLAHDGSNGAWLSRIVINPRTRRALLLSSNEGSERAQAALDQVSFDPRIAAWLVTN